MPLTHVDADMPKWGWVKSLIWYQLWEKDGVPYVTEFDFYAEDNPCPHCGRNDRVWLLTPPHNHAGGVFLGCSLCRRVYGPIDPELYSATPRGRTKTLNLVELAEICKETNQDPPTRELKFEIEKRRLGQTERVQKKRARPPKYGRKVGRPKKTE